MPRRWERELRTLQNVPAPLDRIRDRAARGSEGPAHDLPPRRQRLAAGLVAVAVFLGAGAFAVRAWQSSDAPTIGDITTSTPPAWLVHVARGMAAANQDPSPTSARWVLTDAETAAPAFGFIPDPSREAMYLVVLEGHFTGVAAKTPTGADPPTGTTLVFTLDPATHLVLDWSITSEAIDVEGLVPFELGGVAPSPTEEPTATVTLVESDSEYPNLPGADMTFEADTVHGQPVSYSWGSSIFDTEVPEFKDPLALPSGTIVKIDGDAHSVEVGAVHGSTYGTAEPLDVAPDAFELPLPAGEYFLEVTGTWPKGRVAFLFPIVVQPQDALVPNVAGLTASCGGSVFDRLPPDTSASAPFTSFDELDLSGVGGETLFLREFVLGYEWFVTQEGEGWRQLFGQPSSPGGDPPYASMRIEMGDGGWSPVGWGQCRIELDAEGWGNARFVVDPGTPPDPEADRISVLATEVACASGQVPEDREVRAVILDQDERAVSIVILVEPTKGGADCQGNPAFPFEVGLGSPLGEREILDASVYPPEPQWP